MHFKKTIEAIWDLASDIKQTEHKPDKNRFAEEIIEYCKEILSNEWVLENEKMKQQI